MVSGSPGSSDPQGRKCSPCSSGAARTNKHRLGGLQQRREVISQSQGPGGLHPSFGYHCVQPHGCMRPRTAMNVTQLKIINLLGTWELFMACFLYATLFTVVLTRDLVQDHTITVFKGCGPGVCPKVKESTPPCFSSTCRLNPDAPQVLPVLPCLHPHRAFSALCLKAPSTFLRQGHLPLDLWFTGILQEDLVLDPLSTTFP